jgi:hypothetical protein
MVRYVTKLEGATYPAVVTEVKPDNVANLFVMTDSGTFHVYDVTHCKHKEKGTWHWPSEE